MVFSFLILIILDFKSINNIMKVRLTIWTKNECLSFCKLRIFVCVNTNWVWIVLGLQSNTLPLLINCTGFSFAIIYPVSCVYLHTWCCTWNSQHSSTFRMNKFSNRSNWTMSILTIRMEVVQTVVVINTNSFFLTSALSLDSLFDLFFWVSFCLSNHS